ncbi:aspartate/glutamate racemase family protein [Acuticoccus mangrovi]|uniref:Aspartate/glutamate racemase family protein n=1 Tax=Acuticoccus mangrovi TaxID=2796142 RepID=A0A934MG66_9HYPH|nr:aspartate/glutamate racemase family protein [Acuticoccus mangrovi]
MSERHRTVHGVTVGILMLDTGFERLPGDIGNAVTFHFPVQYAVVRGATSARVVSRRPDAELLPLFIEAARGLVALGVDGIATSCGFLSLFHPELKAALPVPVATSSLLQVALVDQVLPAGRRAGVLTMDAEALTADHLRAVGAPVDVPVAGIAPDSKFRRGQRGNATSVSFADHEADTIAAAERLLASHPEVGALVLECTNMPPYARSLARRFDMPVFDVATLINWFHAGLRPRVYD